MTKKYDTIIVGGGIAGLMTALRLSKNGQKVMIIEKDKIGSGATIANHGTIHSGAHYMHNYPNIVKNCIEAQDLFLNLLPKAKQLSTNSIHVIKTEEFKGFKKQLELYNFSYESIRASDISELKDSVLKKSNFVSIRETVYSSREILNYLLSYCVANGVKILTGNKVQKIKIQSDKVDGIYLGSNEVIKTKNIVITAGNGTLSMLNSFNSHYSKYLKSRIGLMVYLPNMHLTRGFVFMQPVKPVLLPAPNNGVLASIFGMNMPPLLKEDNFSVDYGKSKEVIEGIKKYFKTESDTFSGASFYVSGKTDYINSDNPTSVNPGYNIINHMRFDNIDGLFTVITGKMTLAFHCSKEVSEAVLNKKVSIDMSENEMTKYNPDLLAVEPWNNSNQINT